MEIYATYESATISTPRGLREPGSKRGVRRRSQLQKSRDETTTTTDTTTTTTKSRRLNHHRSHRNSEAKITKPIKSSRRTHKSLACRLRTKENHTLTTDSHYNHHHQNTPNARLMPVRTSECLKKSDSSVSSPRALRTRNSQSTVVTGGVAAAELKRDRSNPKESGLTSRSNRNHRELSKKRNSNKETKLPVIDSDKKIQKYMLHRRQNSSSPTNWKYEKQFDRLGLLLEKNRAARADLLEIQEELLSYDMKSKLKGADSRGGLSFSDDPEFDFAERTVFDASYDNPLDALEKRLQADRGKRLPRL